MSVEKIVPGAFAAGNAADRDAHVPKRSAGGGALALGGFAAIVSSACCVVPLLLVSAGLGGAWIAHVQILAPYRWVFLAAAIIALFFAYQRIFRAATDCAPGAVCALPTTKRAYKAVFWLVAALVLVSISIPYWAPIFY